MEPHNSAAATHMPAAFEDGGAFEDIEFDSFSKTKTTVASFRPAILV